MRNATGQAVTLKTAAQAGGVTLGAGHSTTVFADGTNLRAAPTETRDHRLAGAPEATTPSTMAAGKEVVTAEWVRNLLAGQAIYSTGDFKLTLKAAPDPGWVFLDGKTLGNAGSGATARAHADAEPLYSLIWTNLPDTLAPVAGGRGASAAADFAAGKTIALPNSAGRALTGAGAGPGLTARSLGELFGAETHLLTTAQMPQHNHGGATGDAGAHADLAPLQADLTAYGKRIERMESDMRHLPTRDDIHALRVEVTNMRGELREMRAEARGMKDILTRTEAALTRHEDIIAAAAAARVKP